MNTPPRPSSGAVFVVELERGPVCYGRWRDRTGRQVKRRLGPAWVVADGAGWKRRRGRVPDGVLDEHAADVALAAAITAHEAQLEVEPVDRTA